uniref:RNA helicase n=1 Tax=Meloidogyne floridensis TaxID=298350 RepID=A0A915P5S1_9BILA
MEIKNSMRQWRSYNVNIISNELPIIELNNKGVIYPFLGKDHPFSNFAYAKFNYDNYEWCCTEQAYVAVKAAFFNRGDIVEQVKGMTHMDEVSELTTKSRKIIASTGAQTTFKGVHPREYKFLGKEIEGSKKQTEEWNEKSEQILETLVIQKFTQNTHLGELLIGTKDNWIIEANGNDPVWGVGKYQNNPSLKDWSPNSKEFGLNKMGKILVKVREIIKGNIQSQESQEVIPEDPRGINNNQSSQGENTTFVIDTVMDQQKERTTNEWATSSSGWENTPNKETEKNTTEESGINPNDLPDECRVTSSPDADTGDPTLKDKGIPKYLIARAVEDKVIGARISGVGPFFMEIPDTVFTNPSRRLQMGDLVFVEEWEVREGFEKLGKLAVDYMQDWSGRYTPWMTSGVIQHQATATKAEMVLLRPGNWVTGIVENIKMKRGKLLSAEVMAPNMLRSQLINTRQMTQIRPHQLKKGGIIEVELAQVINPQVWRMGNNYILPEKTPFKRGDEYWAHQNDVIIGSRPSRVQEKYPLMPTHTKDQQEKTMAALAAVAACHRNREDQALRKCAVVTTLNRSAADRAREKTLEDTLELWFSYRPNNLADLEAYSSAFDADTPCLIKVNDPDLKPCAKGEVKEITKGVNAEGFWFEVLLRARHEEAHNYNSSYEHWEGIVGEGWEVQITPIANLKRLQRREDVLSSGFPLALAHSGHMVAPILRTLIGIEGDPPLPSTFNPLENDHPAMKRLNPQQLETVKLFLDGETRLLYQQAPPGAGKTLVSGVAIAAAIRRHPDAVVLAVAPINVAVCELAEDTTKAMSVAGEVVPMLALFSGSGKFKYQQRIEQVGSHLLVWRIKDEDIRDPLMARAGKKVERYERDVKVAPKIAQERTVAFELTQIKRFKVIFMTHSLAEELQLFLDASPDSPDPKKEVISPLITHMVIDEVGQAQHNSVISSVSQFPNLKKLLMTGDYLQLQVHQPSQPMVIRDKLGMNSVLDRLRDCNGVSFVRLTTSYRSHPKLVNCLALSVYEPNGEQLRPGLSESQRDLLTNQIGLNLPIQNTPIILIQQNTAVEMDATSFSLTNGGHTITTVTLLRELVPPLASRRMKILVIGLYTAQVSDIKRAIKEYNWSNVTCSTCDAIQSQEADLVILTTTKTSVQQKQSSEEEKGLFWSDPRRTNVALSRARYGLIVIGDLPFLCQKGEVWEKFVLEACKQTVVVTPAFIELMKSGNIQRVNGVIADYKGEIPIAWDFYEKMKIDNNLVTRTPQVQQAMECESTPSTSGQAIQPVQITSTQTPAPGGYQGYYGPTTAPPVSQPQWTQPVQMPQPPQHQLQHPQQSGGPVIGGIYQKQIIGVPLPSNVPQVTQCSGCHSIVPNVHEDICDYSPCMVCHGIAPHLKGQCPRRPCGYCYIMGHQRDSCPHAPCSWCGQQGHAKINCMYRR